MFQFWKNLSIGIKLWLGFLFLSLLLAVVGWVGFDATRSIQGALNNIHEVSLPAMDYLIEADRDLQQLLVAERSMIFVPREHPAYAALQKDYQTNLEQMKTRMGKFFELAQGDELAALKAGFNEAQGGWEDASSRVLAALDLGTDAGRAQATNLTMGEAGKKFEAMRDYIDKMTGVVLDQAEKDRQASVERYDRLSLHLILLISGSTLAGVLLAFLATRDLTRPIRKSMLLAQAIVQGDLSNRVRLAQRDEMGKLCDSLDAMVDVLEARVKLADAIANGDLDQDVHLSSDKDALGSALQTMVENMNEALGLVKEASDQIAASADQVNDASQSLSQGSTEQAAAIEEINSAMTQIGAQTKGNAENASQANTMMNHAAEVVSNGMTAVHDMAAAMQEISDASRQVAKIIKVIDEIAFQTNLLALNAAVEAARAGSQGKGFAVVAGEVRNLAGRSAKAAQETSELIQRALDKVKAGIGLTDRVNAGFQEIVDSAGGVGELVAVIAKSSNEQAQGVAQVNEAMNQVDQVTQQNTANAEQTASAAAMLSEQAGQLQKNLTKFHLRRAKAESRRALPQSGSPDDDRWGPAEGTGGFDDHDSFDQASEDPDGISEEDGFAKY